MFIKRDKKDDCIIAGMVISEQKEKEYGDKIFYEFGVGIGKDENGSDLPVVNVTTWGRRVEIEKYDRVMACGRLKMTKKDEKTYFCLNADFVLKEKSQRRQQTPKDLSVIDSDESMPF